MPWKAEVRYVTSVRWEEQTFTDKPETIQSNNNLYIKKSQGLGPKIRNLREVKND